MIRGPLYLLTFLAYILALVLTVRQWRSARNGWVHAAWLIPWLAFSVVFEGLLVFRVALYGFSPPTSEPLAFLAALQRFLGASTIITCAIWGLRHR